MRAFFLLAASFATGSLASAEPSVPKADILVVVDDSGSMADKQDKIAHELPSLVHDLNGVDWQIGVVTTTDSCLRGQRVITAGDQDAESAFLAAVAAGTNGDANERGIHSAVRALLGECDGSVTLDWIRPDSTLAVFFVTDEDNYCPAGGCAPGDRPEDLQAALRNLRADSSMSKAYALIWDHNDAMCRNSSTQSDGTQYRSLVQAVGGLTGSICRNDYRPFLQQISADLRRAIDAARH